jgi:hypothetical protein
MANRKTTKPAPSADGKTETVESVESQSAVTSAIAKGRKAASKAEAIDMQAEAAEYNTHYAALTETESRIANDRIAQLPHVAALADILTRVSRVYYGKDTAPVTKAEAESAFPVLRVAASASDAVFVALMSAGLTRGTARNMLSLCRANDALLKMAEAGDIPLGVAYRLAEAADLDSDDYHDAAAAALSPATVGNWYTARVTAKAARDAWARYDKAKNDAAEAAEAARVAANDDDRKAKAAEAKAADERAALAWRDIDAALALIAQSRPIALAEYDSDLASVIEAEANTRKAAEANTRKAAEAEAKAKAEAAKAKIEAAREAAEAAEAATAARKEANAAAKLTNAQIDQIKRRMNAAEASAAEALRAELDAAVKASAANLASVEAAEAAEAEARKVKAEAEAEANAADDEARKARAKVEAEARKAEAKAANTRPTATTLDGLLSIYRKMDAKTLDSELANVAAEIEKAGKTRQWAAIGRGLVLNITK